MIRPRPTLELLLDLCARLRLACEAIGSATDKRVVPADVDLDDLSPKERARLRQQAQADLWVLINQAGTPRTRQPRPLPAPTRRGAA